MTEMHIRSARQPEKYCVKIRSAWPGKKASRLALGICCLIAIGAAGRVSTSQVVPIRGVPVSRRPSVPPPTAEYLWYEAENMRGLTETARHEPQLNPSYL